MKTLPNRTIACLDMSFYVSCVAADFGLAVVEESIARRIESMLLPL
ncbi:MAG: hypothetical protein R3267_00215 [Paenisporosarcina sp.]|nr:hypothetical protein [Paenisporosarcina sp.]